MYFCPGCQRFSCATPKPARPHAIKKKTGVSWCCFNFKANLLGSYLFQPKGCWLYSMLASNIRARVEAHTPRLVGQFALFLSQPPIPNTLRGFFARARQDLRYKVLVLFLLFCVWKKCCHLIMEKRSSFVLPGSDIEDGMSSEVEKGS